MINHFGKWRGSSWGIALMAASISACATDQHVDPRQDNLWSSMKCVGGGCENYTDAQRTALGFEHQRTDALQDEQ